MRISLDDLKDKYLLRDLTAGFSHGRRKILRYASESEHAFYTRINSDGPQPYEYLDFAKNNFALKNAQGYIDAISNAKRAIHQTLDALFNVWGLRTAFRRASFPAKLELMRTVNAFPVRMLENLNQQRNFVEHEYKTVDADQIADFIDVTEMFLMLAHPYLKHAAVSAFVGVDQDERCLEWQIDFLEGQILICEIKKCSLFDSPIGRIYYDISGKDEDKKLIQIVKIEKSNQNDWLIYLDLFVYLTKRNANQLEEPDSRGHGDGVHIMRGSWHFAPGKFNDSDDE